MGELQNNVFDTALVFEGGGMRASYTSAMVNTLLEAGIYFDNVYGVSAGASNSVNYVSRDLGRAKASFTDLANDPHFGGISTFLAHKGIFNAPYIYQEAGKPGAALPFDFESFSSNPAKVTISGFKRDTGETLYWNKQDLSTLDDLMLRVRASSTLPLVMPPPKVEGAYCYDGGLGEGAGMILPKAQADGFERFLVIRTRPKAYRKKEKANAFIQVFFWRHPQVRKALARRSREYNEQLDKLEALAGKGQAYVFYAEEQGVESGERDLAKLRANYDRGYAQAQRELSGIVNFLGLK